MRGGYFKDIDMLYIHVATLKYYSIRE